MIPIAGCGDGVTAYPVTGRVTQSDDRPLVSATVTFKSVEGETTVRSRGRTDENGDFELRLDETHKGVLPGTYQVTVTEFLGDDMDARTKRNIHRRYSSFEKSGLQFTVEPGSNQFDIQVDAPGK